MRRALIRALGALLLFAIGALTGLGLAAETAPRKLRAAVEESLSEALGTPVSIAAARLLVFPGVRVEATQVAAWPGATQPAFTAQRLEAVLDLGALIAARLRFSSITLDGARLELVRGSDGHWTPPVLAPGLDNPLRALGRLFAARLPVPTLDVRSGSLSVTDLAASRAGGGRTRFEIDGLSLRLLARGLLAPGRLQARGALRQANGEPARLQLETEAGRGGAPRLELVASDLALEGLLPYLRERVPDLDLAGRARGILSLASAEGGATELALDLVVSGLEASGWARRVPFAVDELALEGSLRVSAAALEVPDLRLRADGLELSLDGSVARPIDGAARLALEAGLAQIDVARLRGFGPWLPAASRQDFEAATRDLVSGRLLELSLSGDAAIDAWREALEPGGLRLPPGSRIESRVEDLTYQPPGSEPLTATRGVARLEAPAVLTLSGLEGRLGSRALPILDLRVVGLEHVLAAPPAPIRGVPALVGRAALEELLLGPADARAASDAASLELQADWILHPVFVRGLRRLEARLEPTPNGVMWRIAHASWGGLPLRGEGAWNTTAPERVRLALEVGAWEEPAADLPAVGESWAHGRFVVGRPTRPGLRVASLRGGFDLTGTRLTILDAAAELGVPGRLSGDAELDLGSTGEIPARFRLALDDARVADLLGALADEPAHASGAVDVRAQLAGPLRPGAPLLSTLEGEARIMAREGELAVDLPLLLAIAKASTTFNPFGSARGIRFDRIDAELAIEGGRIATARTITIESPDLRLAVSGSVDARERPHRLEAVVGCFFFKPLDQVLGAMPVVSRILLGPDRSLFGTFFALTGSWEDPSAGIIPTRAVAFGPASFLLEDVPSFVKRGVEAIASALPDLGGRPPAVASPAEAAKPAGDGS